MRQVPVYKGQRLLRWAEVSEVDYDHLIQWKWTGTVNDSYAARWDPAARKAILMHREILNLRPGDGLEVDHIDGDGFNNRRSNLRLATRSEQIQNTRTRSKWGRGVTQAPSGRFRAQAKLDQRTIYLGTFDSADEAAAAARVFRLEHYACPRDESPAGA